MHIGQNRINLSLYNFLKDNYIDKIENKENKENDNNKIDFKFDSEFIDFKENEIKNTNKDNDFKYEVYI
jgi:hypothetical protein